MSLDERERSHLLILCDAIFTKPAEWSTILDLTYDPDLYTPSKDLVKCFNAMRKAFAKYDNLSKENLITLAELFLKRKEPIREVGRALSGALTWQAKDK